MGANVVPCQILGEQMPGWANVEEANVRGANVVDSN